MSSTFGVRSRFGPSSKVKRTSGGPGGWAGARRWCADPILGLAVATGESRSSAAASGAKRIDELPIFFCVRLGLKRIVAAGARRSTLRATDRRQVGRIENYRLVLMT